MKRIVLVTRYPEAGKAKTRLIPSLGKERAAEIHRQLTERTVKTLRELPVVTPLNVNTAPPLVIAALSDQLSLGKAEAIVKERPENGYVKLEDFLAQLVGTGLTDTAGLSLASDYFLVEARAIFGHAEVVLFSVLHRSVGGVEVISRSIGTY